ncbi:unnamed protein product [Sphenostylis stenocarpa]|uniref:Uncharacterized protein n=1 Tax=Sphenostylis stenocarpa TaxID=92480 RepID=A0AA86RXD5_9FABA|nr:unnamed protein product [Sphenostylis stenocarpa]
MRVNEKGPSLRKLHPLSENSLSWPTCDTTCGRGGYDIFVENWTWSGMFKDGEVLQKPIIENDL